MNTSLAKRFVFDNRKGNSTLLEAGTLVCIKTAADHHVTLTGKTR